MVRIQSSGLTVQNTVPPGIIVITVINVTADRRVSGCGNRLSAQALLRHRSCANIAALYHDIDAGVCTPMKTEQKIAVVTGANRGIGFEICRQLLQKDYHVLLTARDQVKGARAVEKLRGAGPIEFFLVDVTSRNDVDALGRRLQEHYGRCDVLVNNAGIFPDPRDDLDNEWPSLLTADIDDVQKGIETNTYGTLRLCQMAVPLMRQAGYGRIVNLSSGMGQLSDMNGCCPGYRISKAGVNVITRILADELQGENILVNSMCPGWVKTDMGGPGATRELPEGADTAVWLATLPDDGPSGLFFRDRTPIPW